MASFICEHIAFLVQQILCDYSINLKFILPINEESVFRFKKNYQPSHPLRAIGKVCSNSSNNILNLYHKNLVFSPSWNYSKLIKSHCQNLEQIIKKIGGYWSIYLYKEESPNKSNLLLFHGKSVPA